MEREGSSGIALVAHRGRELSQPVLASGKGSQSAPATLAAPYARFPKHTSND